MKKFCTFICLLITVLFIPFWVKPTFAQEDAQAMLEKFAPALYFHPSEIFRPQPVDVLVENARLRQNRSFWFDSNILAKVSIPDLFSYRDESFFLDAWYGDEELSDSNNYSFHRLYYETTLRPEVGGHPVVTYGRMVQDEASGFTVLQYWLFYYYNDWFNKHEGDWELVQVMLDPQGEPQEVVLSQHHGGTRRVWRDAHIEDGTHPAAYVALGSHANYFWGDELYPNGVDVGNSRIEIMDRTGSFGRVIPEVIQIPDAEEPRLTPGNEWLFFGGNWGEAATIEDFGGPSGPTQKGQQWEQPYHWGIAQPLDRATWYANRLRIEVQGEYADQVQVRLSSSQKEGIEHSTGIAILHRNPHPDESFQAEISAPADSVVQLLANWPDAGNSQVWQYLFEDVQVSETGKFFLTLAEGENPKLIVDGESLSPNEKEPIAATWDAPDFVWMVNLLPAGEIVSGVFIALVAAVLPTILFMGLIYWTDRYEKEPKRLIVAVFLWGAIPALIFSLLARLFIQLPTSTLSPTIMAALRTGIVIPLIEELLKGVIVLFILLRHRREFDDALDGIVYGALVGFGFAMSRNLVSFLNGFFLQGFVALNAEILLTGVIYTLNHGAYTAIFGAGLGFARLSQKNGLQKLVPMAAFILAVGVHIAHNLAVHAVTGQNLLSMIFTLSGLILLFIIVVMSLHRQKTWLQEELKGDLSDDLYRVIVSSSARAKSQWHALISRGFGGWRRTRRLHQSCTELAFKLRQSKMFPGEKGLFEEVEILRQDIERLIRLTQSSS